MFVKCVYSGTVIQEKIQTCEEETKKLHTEKSDLIDKYQGLLQQQKAWQSAIADCNAAKV